MTIHVDRVVVPALFAGLLDDAAIFPPGNAPMPDAVAAHAATLLSADAPYVGMFLCSSDRLGELQQTRPPRELVLSLVVRGAAEAVAPAVAEVERAGLDLRAVEIALATADLRSVLAALPAAVVRYIELPLDAALPATARAVADSGCLVKLRTGGVAASAFPAEAALADGIAACIRTGVPFKLTAGLHHAVRHRDPATGFEHHGFLNVLGAVARAVEGASAAAVTEVLAERDASPLVDHVVTMDDALVTRVRSSFVSFGTCSTTEPLDDLRSLGLIPRASR